MSKITAIINAMILKTDNNVSYGLSYDSLIEYTATVFHQTSKSSSSVTCNNHLSGNYGTVHQKYERDFLELKLISLLNMTMIAPQLFSEGGYHRHIELSSVRVRGETAHLFPFKIHILKQIVLISEEF